MRKTHPRVLVVLLVTVGLSAAGCRGRSPGGVDTSPVPHPGGPLALPDARAYVLALVNHDRALEGLSPVEWDEAAERAGQRHAEDMAATGYTAHWGTDGSVPEERYTNAGGEDYVQENAACFFDGQRRALVAEPLFDPVALVRIEAAFMAEVPPNDGHRRNILKPSHRRFGVGLSLPTGLPQPCMSQEFVDDHGTYAALPADARVGAQVEVAGEVDAPVEFGAVGVARVAPAAPMSVEALHATSTYPVPEPYVLYAPEGFETPLPVHVEGRRFSIRVPLSDRSRPGRYEVSVWGHHPGETTLFMISLRTVNVH